MNQKTSKSLRSILCFLLAFVILSSMLFVSMMVIVTSAVTFDTWNKENPDNKIESWVLHFYYNMIIIWFFAISIVAVFVVCRFIWYPDIIFTKEFKDKCFPKRGKLLKKGKK